MRKTADIPPPGDFRRVMICSSPEGFYLFLYRITEDGPCNADEWYESLEDVEQVCEDRFGIKPEDWVPIKDAPEGCQQDWITATKIKTDASGQKLWGQFERADL